MNGLISEAKTKTTLALWARSKLGAFMKPSPAKWLLQSLPAGRGIAPQCLRKKAETQEGLAAALPGEEA